MDRAHSNNRIDEIQWNQPTSDNANDDLAELIEAHQKYSSGYSAQKTFHC